MVGGLSLLAADRIRLWPAVGTLANVAARYTNQSNLLDLARHGYFLSELLPWERLHFDPSAG